MAIMTVGVESSGPAAAGSPGEIVWGELSVGIVWKMPRLRARLRGKRMPNENLGGSWQLTQLTAGGNFVWRILIVRPQLPFSHEPGAN